MTHAHKRLVAERFRRIWAIVEDIAASPGHTRAELARKFHLSERHIQSDLNVIRTDMRLPLIRRSGYRFADEAAGIGGESMPDLREAQLLVMILRQATKDRAIPRDRFNALIAKLPAMFPAHLQPLVQRTLDAVTAPRSGQWEQVFAGLAEALLRGVAVKLHYPLDHPSSPNLSKPIIVPELLVPYLDSWYVIGAVRQRGDRTVMLSLDGVVAVTLAETTPEPERMGRAS